jgi:hypothetical protein
VHVHARDGDHGRREVERRNELRRRRVLGRHLEQRIGIDDRVALLDGNLVEVESKCARL